MVLNQLASDFSESRTLTPAHLILTRIALFEDFKTSFDIQNRHKSEIEYDNEKQFCGKATRYYVVDKKNRPTDASKS